MAGNISDYLEVKILDHVTGRLAMTAPTHTYGALYLVAPTDSGAGSEVLAGEGYVRQQIVWGEASLDGISNNDEIRWPSGVANATADWGIVVAVGILDALTAGNLLWYGNLSSSVTVGTGSSFKIASGGLTLSLD